MKLSRFGKRFSRPSGIVQLMQDLGSAMAGNGDYLMLGGGNPAHIPEVQAFFVDRMQRLLERPAEFAHVIGDYDPPGGDPHFIAALAELFRDSYGWNVSARNIALTSGSQAAFFMLFNMFAGEFDDAPPRRILLPMTPEYIGYGDVGLSDRLFTATRPTIEKLPERTFKYHVDFSRLVVDESIGAICVSRPTNPTGNVISDAELERLRALAQLHDIPLIVDNAYGKPFPNIVFTGISVNWDEGLILCMSLSKLGLPGARTGIIIAAEEVIAGIESMNGVFNLAMGSFGPALTLDLVTSGEILRLADTVIRPFYERKATHAIDLFHQALREQEYYIHKAEGALFLWLWFPGLPISSEELYQRLKRRGVLVLSGHYFFPGLEGDWEHTRECIRVSYAMPDSVVERGAAIIGEEIRRAYAAGGTCAA